MKFKLIGKTLAASSGVVVVLIAGPAVSQIVPRPWVSVGVKDDEATFSVGAKAIGLGVELGAGPNGATGVDLLKFINLPVVSPYVGLGLYSEDEGLAYSAGVQVDASKNLFVGAGYNSVRGVNGQLGIRF